MTILLQLEKLLALPHAPPVRVRRLLLVREEGQCALLFDLMRPLEALPSLPASFVTHLILFSLWQQELHPEGCHGSRHPQGK